MQGTVSLTFSYRPQSYLVTIAFNQCPAFREPYYSLWLSNIRSIGTNVLMLSWSCFLGFILNPFIMIMHDRITRQILIRHIMTTILVSKGGLLGFGFPPWWHNHVTIGIYKIDTVRSFHWWFNALLALFD